MTFQQSQFGQLEDPYNQGPPPRRQVPIIKANSAAIFGNFDGVIRPAEAIGVLAFFLATTLILGVFVLILWLLGVSPEWRRNVALVTEVLIFAVCVFRLAGDLLQLDPAGLVFEIKEYREFREDYQAFKKWRLAEEYGSPRKVEHTATVTVREGTRTRHYLGLSGEDLEEAVTFAKAYQEKRSAGVENLTAESHWVGKGTMWPAGAAGRAGWKTFKEFWMSKKMAKVVDGRGAWKFTKTGTDVLAQFAKLELKDD